MKFADDTERRFWEEAYTAALRGLCSNCMDHRTPDLAARAADRSVELRAERF